MTKKRLKLIFYILGVVVYLTIGFLLWAAGESYEDAPLADSIMTFFYFLLLWPIPVFGKILFG